MPYKIMINSLKVILLSIAASHRIQYYFHLDTLYFNSILQENKPCISETRCDSVEELDMVQNMNEQTGNGKNPHPCSTIEHPDLKEVS